MMFSQCLIILVRYRRQDCSNLPKRLGSSVLKVGAIIVIGSSRGHANIAGHLRGVRLKQM
eukprot:2923733-Prorocentrum_lima.AAC.1